MKIKNLPAYLLTAGFLLFIAIFGVMTVLSGGGHILSGSVAAYAYADAMRAMFALKTDDEIAALDGRTDMTRRAYNAPLAGIKTALNAVDSEYKLTFFHKFDFVTLHGAMRRYLGESFFPDSASDVNIVKLNDGLLAQLKTRLDVEQCAQPLEDIKAFLDTRDIGLIFTYVHTKVHDPQSQLPLGATDHSNAIADRFLRMLDKLGIEYIDTRAVLNASGIPVDRLYFSTDAHWTIPAAFEVFGALTDKLNCTGRFSIDPSIADIGRYDVTTYEGQFLGSDGRNAEVFWELDDFTTIIPNYETGFSERSVNPDGEWEYREGSFTEAVMYMDRLEPEENQLYSLNSYSAYGYNRAEQVITNELVDTGKVLFIKNSSGNPVSAFTALGVNEVCGLDRRVLGTTTIADYIDAYRPDAVVIVYNFDFLKPDRLDIFNINEDLGLD